MSRPEASQPADLIYPDGPPRRRVRLPRGAKPCLEPAPAWIDTGPRDRPFDFCAHARHLCADIAARTPELAHVDATRVQVAAAQARNAALHGLQARLTPLRPRGGLPARRWRGRAYRVQRLRVAGREMLYLLEFLLPRFLDQTYDHKLITFFHELHHASPGFEGGLRREPGRSPLHPSGKRAYDVRMADLARRYLASGPDPAAHAWLRLSFGQLLARHGGVEAACVPRPRLIPLEDGNG